VTIWEDFEQSFLFFENDGNEKGDFMERLQKLIAQAGVASRRAAEQLIVEGRVKVDGQLVQTLGTLVDPSASIEVDGSLLRNEELVYYVMNKPSGYLSTTADDKDRRTVIDLLPVNERIYPIGRLDYDTTGVLLLTNDGEFANAMIHPRFKVEKEYHVKVKGLIRREESQMLRQGIHLGEFESQPAKIFDVRYDDNKVNSYAKVIIHEGKYHQITRMFEAIDHPVLKLRRERFGVINCDGLKQGEYRKLKPHEIKQLWNLALNGKS
jgi:23S rRNA pseudouridine2605 synthase